MFAERQLKFTFSGAQSGSFSAAGLRAEVSVQAFQDKSGTMAQVKIWGLSMGQMNAYSSRISSAPGGLALTPFNLKVEAGDLDGDSLSTVINGQIWRSYIDLSAAPESAFVVWVSGTIYQASAPIGPGSWAGDNNAEDLIRGVCAEALPKSMTLHNNGAHAVLRNETASGSAVEQITAIAQDADFRMAFDGDDVYIWAPGGTRDGIVISVGPGTEPKMVGYPVFTPTGIVVTSLYNPGVLVGRQMQVTSSLQNAVDLWDIIEVHHELTTMVGKGPWFTIAVLVPVGSTVSTGGSDDDDADD